MSADGAGPMPIAVLVSGYGSNLQALLARISEGLLAARVSIVISDKQDAPALERASAAGIPTRVIPPSDFPDRQTWTAAVTQALQKSGVGLVVLAGFMRILGPALMEAYAGRILNIHPSLLPRYRGLDTYRRALAAGDREHGASVHFVTPELDGGPVIAQVRIPITESDDAASLKRRLQQQEHWLYPEIVDWFAKGRIAMRGDKVWLDGAALSKPVSLKAREAQTAPSGSA